MSLYHWLLSVISRFFAFPPSSPFPGSIPVHKQICGVIEPRRKRFEPEEWLYHIPGNLHPLRLTQLDSCVVTEVRHYRQKKGTLPHEFIACIVRSPKDTRVIRYDRRPQEGWPESAGTMNWSGDLDWSSEDAAGKRDKVELMSTEHLVDDVHRDRYALVQSIRMPLNTMKALDVAVLVSIISSSAKSYSLFQHMSWWTSAIFFQTIVSTYHLENEIVSGPLFKEQGRAFGFHMVKPGTCELILPRGEDYEHVMNKLKQACGSMLEGGEADAVMDALKKDAEKMAEGPLCDSQAQVGRN